MSSSMSGVAAAHKASALASNTRLIKLPPARLPARPLLKPLVKKTMHVMLQLYKSYMAGKSTDNIS